MGQYNREVINAYREAKCLQCFIMGRIDATDMIPTGSHKAQVLESPGGDIFEFQVTHQQRE
jgi:hypothetical protein